MKILKLSIILLSISLISFSCTPEVLEDNLNNNVEDVQATGDDDKVEDGSKD